MRGCKSTELAILDLWTTGFLLLFAVGCAAGADDPGRIVGDDHAEQAGHIHHVHAADAGPTPNGADELRQFATGQLQRIGAWLRDWYERTPPADRVIWGGMAASAGLGLGVLLERLVRLRRRKIVPPDFTARFLDRLHDGKLDCGQALDHCELNPSPAARVALAAVRRWGRPSADLERAVALAHRVESEQLRRNVGTLRRIAALTPLLGLLGTLFALGRALESVPPISPAGLTAPTPISAPLNPSGSSIAWGPALAAALSPFSVGIIIATLALVAYDGLLVRIEKLAGSLDRLGAETIDAIALSAPVAPPPITLAGAAPRRTVAPTEEGLVVPVAPTRGPHRPSNRRDASTDSRARSVPHETGF